MRGKEKLTALLLCCALLLSGCTVTARISQSGVEIDRDPAEKDQSGETSAAAPEALFGPEDEVFVWCEGRAAGTEEEYAEISLSEQERKELEQLLQPEQWTPVQENPERDFPLVLGVDVRNGEESIRLYLCRGEEGEALLLRKKLKEGEETGESALYFAPAQTVKDAERFLTRLFETGDPARAEESGA